MMYLLHSIRASRPASPSRWPLYLLLFPLLLGSMACGVSEEDISTTRSPIIKGVRSGDYLPGVGALVYEGWGFYQSFCTGTLISKRYVLTAAHCLQEGQMPNWVKMGFYMGPDAWRANAAKVVEVAEKIPHPKYRGGNPPGGLADYYDIALLKLAKDAPVAWLKMLRPKKEGTALALGDDVLIMGYGLTDPNNHRSSGVKYHGTSKLLQVAGTEIYVENPSGTNTCEGDSGGPTFADVSKKGEDPEYRIIGVTSRGAEGCGYGSVQTRVDAYLEWIHGIVKNVPCGSGLSQDCRGNEPDPSRPPKKSFGESCQAHDECEGALCALVHGEGSCSQLCDTRTPNCPSGYECASVDQAKGVCVKIPPKQLDLGETCAAHDDCKSKLCAGQGDTFFCSEFCDPNVGCEAGLDCVSAGGDKYVCAPADGKEPGGGGNVPGGEPGGCAVAASTATHGSSTGFGLIGLLLLGLVYSRRSPRR